MSYIAGRKCVDTGKIGQALLHLVPELEPVNV
jgi:hypothetical protein